MYQKNAPFLFPTDGPRNVENRTQGWGGTRGGALEESWAWEGNPALEWLERAAPARLKGKDSPGEGDQTVDMHGSLVKGEEIVASHPLTKFISTVEADRS